MMDRLDVPPMPFVVDVRRLRAFGQAPNEVYIGRQHPRFPGGSAWGNLFRAGSDAVPDLAIINFIKWIHAPQRAELLARIPELAGKTPGCWCSPHTCYGHVLTTLANNPIVYAYFRSVSHQTVLAIRSREDAWPLIPTLRALREHASR